jgi:hypothetical protein
MIGSTKHPTPTKYPTPASLKDETAILIEMFAVHLPLTAESGSSNKVIDLQPGAPYDREHCSDYKDEMTPTDVTKLIDKNTVFQYAFNGFNDESAACPTVASMPTMWNSVKNALTLPSL